MKQFMALFFGWWSLASLLFLVLIPAVLIYISGLINDDSDYGDDDDDDEGGGGDADSWPIATIVFFFVFMFVYVFGLGQTSVT